MISGAFRRLGQTGFGLGRVRLDFRILGLRVFRGTEGLVLG